MAPKFLRQDSHRHHKLGRNNKKKQVWRLPKGRHSKMRQQLKGHIPLPTIGYKQSKKTSGKIQNLAPVLIHNLNEMKKVTPNHIVILAKLGAKKRIELIKYADEHKIKILNLGGSKK